MSSKGGGKEQEQPVRSVFELREINLRKRKNITERRLSEP